ncbi:hypothetical protein CPLU01_06225 [Colletotrichum plurivorum]|uniref:Uncharacterized protein n=1 Tax=Colletotrichum plurivorum TaxID=2175906 RepID=A0A8H6NH52_9PEZI|nr:hypothetical protein CPLU01_06225 [Colletotrichum plurivorum]
MTPMSCSSRLLGEDKSRRPTTGATTAMASSLGDSERGAGAGLGGVRRLKRHQAKPCSSMTGRQPLRLRPVIDRPAMPCRAMHAPCVYRERRLRRTEPDRPADDLWTADRWLNAEPRRSIRSTLLVVRAGGHRVARRHRSSDEGWHTEEISSAGRMPGPATVWAAQETSVKCRWTALRCGGRRSEWRTLTTDA